MGLREKLNNAISNNSNDEVSELLMKMSADDVNATDNIVHMSDCGLTPLHRACYDNNTHAVAQLLAFPGIQVNKSAQTIFMEKSGKTPIMEAARRGNIEALKLMLDDPRVDLDIKDWDGKWLEQFLEYCKDEKRKNACLEMIKQETNRRRKKTLEVQKNGDVDDAIGEYYNEQLEKVNLEIQDGRKRYKLGLEQRRMKMRGLLQKQDAEEKTLGFEANQAVVKMEHQKSKLEQELAILQKNLDQAKQINELNQEKLKIKHDEERGVLVSTLLKEEKDDHEHLDNLQKITIQLTKNVQKRRRDIDTENDASSRLEAARDTLECPVCLDTMKPPSRIWMCQASHLICEPCKIRLDRRRCPTCRTENVTLRAFMAEKFARTIFDK